MTSFSPFQTVQELNFAEFCVPNYQLAAAVCRTKFCNVVPDRADGCITACNQCDMRFPRKQNCFA